MNPEQVPAAISKKRDGHTAFSDTDVVERSQQFIMLKIDLTTGANPKYQKLIDTFDVQRVSTVIFINWEGEERVDLRMIDYRSPKDFLSSIGALNTLVCGIDRYVAPSYDPMARQSVLGALFAE